MRKLSMYFYAIFLITATTQVSAQIKRLQLPYYGEQMRGQNTLYLKQRINNAYPGINLRQAELEKVILVAKTKHGGGKVALRVGPNVGYDMRVGGDPYDFNERGHYYRVRMENYDGSRGAWQLKLRGNFKIKKVVVVINTRNRPSRPMVTRYCKYKLKSLFGRKKIKSFRAEATGQRNSGVQERACRKARNYCLDFKESFGDLGSLGVCRED